jgi:probable HAF family extracellular repeat protein
MSGRFTAVALAALISACLTLPPLAKAQAQASCTFKIFQLNPSDPNNPGTEPNGVNDFASVVGAAVNPPANTVIQKAFVRFSGGGVNYFSPPDSISAQFYARNNNGVTVGDYADSSFHPHAFMLQGSTLTPIVDPKAAPFSTDARGINKFNSIVGSYTDTNGKEHGFKRFSNGSFNDLNFPGGSQATNPNAINDSGTIVGSYTAADGSLNGFIFNNNSWATLNFPQTTGTELFGISNAGVIIGLDHSTESGRAFMYSNGQFKVISVPNSFSTEATGIAPGGLITGRVNVNGTDSGRRGFTATCK